MLQRMHTDTEKRDDENETDDGNLKKNYNFFENCCFEFKFFDNF